LNHDKQDGVTFVGRWPLQFATAVPYISELLERGVPVYFVVSKPVADIFAPVIQRGAGVQSLEALEKQHRLPRLVHSLCSRLAGLAARGPRQNRARNALCAKVVSKCLDNPLPTAKVVHVTKSNVPWLLCANGVRVYTMIGSWDHPAKFGATGYKSDMVFIWNEDLAEDWREFQGDKHFARSFPFAFDYLLNRPVGDRQVKAGNRCQILFPFTSSSSSHPAVFREELAVAGAFIGACTKYGLNVFVKPKPNGVPGELHVLEQYGNVRIGQYYENNKKENILLTPEYNAIRMEELSLAGSVLNIATTFAFDAALYGLPVIQLEFMAPQQFPEITRIQHHVHTQRHILEVKPLVHRMTDRRPLEEQFDTLLSQWSEVESIAIRHGQRLRQWMTPKQTAPDNIRDVVDIILA